MDSLHQFALGRNLLDTLYRKIKVGRKAIVLGAVFRNAKPDL